jgi:hypothetical protein
MLLNQEFVWIRTFNMLKTKDLSEGVGWEHTPQVHPFPTNRIQKDGSGKPIPNFIQR